MLTRQDRRQIMTTYIVGLFILCGSCFAIYKLIYEPLKSELIYLHDRLTQSTPASYRLPQGSLGHYQPWYAALQLSPEQLRNRLINLVSKSHVDLQELRVEARESAQPFSKIPIYLKMQGKFTHVMQLLVSLANSHLTYCMRNIHLLRINHRVEAVLHLEIKELE